MNLFIFFLGKGICGEQESAKIQLTQLLTLRSLF